MMGLCKVIEGHCHLASSKVVPESFFLGVAENLSAKSRGQGKYIPADKMLQLLLAQHVDHDGDALVAEQLEAGISSAVLLAPDFSYALESEPTYKKIIDHHLRVCKRHPGHFELFAGVDPHWGVDAISFFESLVQSGDAKGLKLYPPCGYSPSDPVCYPLYEICDNYKIPVLLHTGPTSPALSFRYTDPFLLDDAAKRFPKVNFIAAHGAVNNWKEHLMLAKFRPNVFLDISGFHGVVGEGGWKAHVLQLLHEGMNHKIIFGTDWPIFRTHGSMKQVIDEYLGEGGLLQNLPQNDIKNFMYRNIESILVHK